MARPPSAVLQEAPTREASSGEGLQQGSEAGTVPSCRAYSAGCATSKPQRTLWGGPLLPPPSPASLASSPLVRVLSAAMINVLLVPCTRLPWCLPPGDGRALASGVTTQLHTLQSDVGVPFPHQLRLTSSSFLRGPAAT